MTGSGGEQRYVTTEGLRLRARPNGTILRELTIADPVIDLGANAQPGWRNVVADGTEGVVFGKYLRDPARPEVERLLRAAVDEWLRFDKGHAIETDDPQYLYIGEMWAALGEPHDGRSDVRWSAAFMSWVVRQAGPPYANFRFSARHSVYVHNAIKARVTSRLDKPYWGYRIREVKPELGDIIHRNRGSNRFTFSYAETHTQYDSHADFVVEVTPDIARVVGGNVANSVTLGGDVQEYELDDDGFIAKGQGVIALLKNRAGLAE